MTESEYAAQLAELGSRVHLNDDVWWLSLKPGYCRPIWRARCFSPGSAKPLLRESLLGYSHGTSVGKGNKKAHQVMRRDLSEGETFGITSVSSNRRSKIRRAGKRLEIQLIPDITPYLPQMMDVVMDARRRTGIGLPVEYYERHGASWQKNIGQMGSMKDNFFLGALKEGQLVAYYHCLIVERVVSITAAKSHTDHLRDYPNDALIFKALDCAYNEWQCLTVLFGDFVDDDPALNKFKKGYGFQAKEISQYECLRPGVGLMKRVAKRGWIASKMKALKSIAD